MLISSQDIPSPLAEFVQSRSEGNPLYIEELIGALKESGLVRVAEIGNKPASSGRRVVSQLLDRSVPLPGTIQGIVASKIDRLHHREQHLLQV